MTERSQPSADAPTNCPRCGAAVDAGERFCDCGYLISNEPTNLVDRLLREAPHPPGLSPPAEPSEAKAREAGEVAVEADLSTLTSGEQRRLRFRLHVPVGRYVSGTLAVAFERSRIAPRVRPPARQSFALTAEASSASVSFSVLAKHAGEFPITRLDLTLECAGPSGDPPRRELYRLSRHSEADVIVARRAAPGVRPTVAFNGDVLASDFDFRSLVDAAPPDLPPPNAPRWTQLLLRGPSREQRPAERRQVADREPARDATAPDAPVVPLFKHLALRELAKHPDGGSPPSGSFDVVRDGGFPGERRAKVGDRFSLHITAGQTSRVAIIACDGATDTATLLVASLELAAHRATVISGPAEGDRWVFSPPAGGMFFIAFFAIKDEECPAEGFNAPRDLNRQQTQDVIHRALEAAERGVLFAAGADVVTTG